MAEDIVDSKVSADNVPANIFDILPEYVQRLVVEYNETNNRFVKLAAFITSGSQEYNSLDFEDKELLSKQHMAMGDLVLVLRRRLNSELEKNTLTTVVFDTDDKIDPVCNIVADISADGVNVNCFNVSATNRQGVVIHDANEGNEKFDPIFLFFKNPAEVEKVIRVLKTVKSSLADLPKF